MRSGAILLLVLIGLGMPQRGRADATDLVQLDRPMAPALRNPRLTFFAADALAMTVLMAGDVFLVERTQLAPAVLLPVPQTVFLAEWTGALTGLRPSFGRMVAALATGAGAATVAFALGELLHSTNAPGPELATSLAFGLASAAILSRADVDPGD